MKPTKKLKGIIVPIVTPKIDSNIDQSGLTKIIQFMSDNVNGIFALGTTGEFQYLTLQQKEAVLKTVSETISPNTLFLVGISAKELNESLELIKLAQKYKADAIVFAPLYGKGNLQARIDTIIKDSVLPIVLYNNPPIHNQEYLSIDNIRSLSFNPKVIGIKDSSGNWDYFSQLLSLRSDKFVILQGREEYTLDSLRLGASGVVSGYANIEPVLLKELLQLRTKTILNKFKRLKNYIKATYNNSIAGFKNELFLKRLIQTPEMFKL